MGAYMDFDGDVRAVQASCGLVRIKNGNFKLNSQRTNSSRRGLTACDVSLSWDLHREKRHQSCGERISLSFAADRIKWSYPTRNPADGGPARGIENTGCARRKHWDRIFGQGFDSPRLHHNIRTNGSTWQRISFHFAYLSAYALLGIKRKTKAFTIRKE